jgi:excisionase family DNA binding protein
MSFVFDYLKKSTQQFFEPSEAAMLLNVHANTIRRWADDGLLRPCEMTLKGHRRISREALLMAGASFNYQG